MTERSDVFEGDLSAVFGVDASHEEIAAKFERETYRGREYHHLPDERHGIERGTVLIDDVVVPGFPSIPRVLVLDPGVPEYFDGPVAIEEKLNGYNVRIASVDGDLLAFTRSGYVCPYTTDLVRDDPFTDFLADYPDLTVCGELVGPENPYTAHDYAEVEGAELRVFDLRENRTGTPLDVETRYEYCETYDLPATPRFGVHDSETIVDEVAATIEELDDRGREGVMLKSLDGTRQLKYTTSAIHREDLAHAFGQPFDYGREFVFARVIREAFQAAELEETDAETRERARKLGEAILLPAVEAIEAVESDEVVGQEHVIRGNVTAIESLLALFRSVGLHLDVEDDYYDDGERVVRFHKVATASQDKIEHYLDGGTIDQ